jgi:cytochrome c
MRVGQMKRFLVAAVAACTLLVGLGIASAGQLIEAAESGDVELVRQLIDGGADPNEQGQFGAALHRALARRHNDVVALLVARGADVNVANPLLGTPLHVAAATGNEATVLLLLERGASVTVARGADGYTPLHAAAEPGRARVVRLLLDHGADVNSLTHGRIGAHALHLAELRGRTEVAQMLREGGAMAPPVEPIVPLMAVASAERGQVGARNCTSCHAVDPAAKWPSAGPALWGVVGCAPASSPGFKYSSALERLGGAWNEEALNAFVAHPMATAPGTSTQFEGLADAEGRADLIAYLRTLSDTLSPAPR